MPVLWMRTCFGFAILQFSVKHVKFEILIVAFQENIDFTTKILAQSNSFLDLILG